jgi:sugar phosphate isomerase/epimerase
LSDGTVPLDILLGDEVPWEIDIGWAVRAGVDPAPWIKRYAGRIPAVHVKDVAPGDDLTVEGGWADVGEGVVNWSLLWELAVQAGSELMVVEHDAPSDYKRFATRSIAAMKRLAGVA